MVVFYQFFPKTQNAFTGRVFQHFPVQMVRRDVYKSQPYLQSGDKVALVSPAGIIDPLSIHDAVEVLRSWKLNPIVGPNAAATYGYFAGRDERCV